MNYMDRFLSVCQIKKSQLQLLGTACLLLASKLREPKPISADYLVFYTDNSITKDDLWVSLSLSWPTTAICARSTFTDRKFVGFFGGKPSTRGGLSHGAARNVTAFDDASPPAARARFLSNTSRMPDKNSVFSFRVPRSICCVQVQVKLAIVPSALLIGAIVSKLPHLAIARKQLIGGNVSKLFVNHASPNFPARIANWCTVRWLAELVSQLGKVTDSFILC